MPDELAARIASYSPDIVRGAPEYAREIYNQARKSCGMPEVDFTKV